MQGQNSQFGFTGFRVWALTGLGPQGLIVPSGLGSGFWVFRAEH